MTQYWTNLRLCGCLAVVALMVGCPAKPTPTVTPSMEAEEPAEDPAAEEAPVELAPETPAEPTTT